MTDFTHVATLAELISHDWYMSDEGRKYEYAIDKKSDVYFCRKCMSMALTEVGKGPPDKTTGVIFCNAKNCEEVITENLFSYL